MSNQTQRIGFACCDGVLPFHSPDCPTQQSVKAEQPVTSDRVFLCRLSNMGPAVLIRGGVPDYVATTELPSPGTPEYKKLVSRLMRVYASTRPLTHLAGIEAVLAALRGGK